MLALRSCFAVCLLLVAASPAAAQWTPVVGVPATHIVSVSARGDTIVAGADTVVFVSTDAGATWKRSTKVAVGVVSVEAVLVRDGRLYAGTHGQGVHVSDDLGDTWAAFNQGLVGGLFDSQLYIADFLVRGDSLYAATSGAGTWVRNLVAGTWSHYGNAFEPNQASNMNGIAAGGSRLLAAAGFNGTVFFRDPGDADWTLSWLDNVGIVPGLAAFSAAWTGQGWVVGSNIGVFRSALGQEPWTLWDPGLGTLFNVGFVTRGPDLFAVLGTGGGSVTVLSRDDGATWQELETLPATFTYDLTLSGSDLYAGRVDGLWRRSIATVSVPDVGRSRDLRFAIVGPQPVSDRVRFRFEMPEPGVAAVEVFDIGGRRASEPVRDSWPAGAHELNWDAAGLAPGVYHARLTANGRQAVVRIVRAR